MTVPHKRYQYQIEKTNGVVFPSTHQKHLLLESWMDLSDNVEKELLYFQVLYTLRADKFPVKQVEAVSDLSVPY